MPPTTFGPEHDRRAQQVERELGVDLRLGLEQRLELGLLLRVEQPRGRPGRPVLVDRRRGCRRGSRRPPPTRRRRTGGTPAAAAARNTLSVPSTLIARVVSPRGVAGDQERQVDDDVGAGEGLRSASGSRTSPCRYSIFVQPRSAGSNGRRAMPMIRSIRSSSWSSGTRPGAERAGRAGDRDGQSTSRRLAARARRRAPRRPRRLAGLTERLPRRSSSSARPSPAWPGRAAPRCRAGCRRRGRRRRGSRRSRR